MSTLITNQPVAPNRMRGRVRICLDGIRPAFGSDLAAHRHPSHLISVQPNGRDEQIAAVDSKLRKTLSRFCSIAWFANAPHSRPKRSFSDLSM